MQLEVILNLLFEDIWGLGFEHVSILILKASSVLNFGWDLKLDPSGKKFTKIPSRLGQYKKCWALGANSDILCIRAVNTYTYTVTNWFISKDIFQPHGAVVH